MPDVFFLLRFAHLANRPTRELIIIASPTYNLPSVYCHP
jgi:hypothetical protein